jgi:hypothetical protein
MIGSRRMPRGSRLIHNTRAHNTRQPTSMLYGSSRYRHPTQDKQSGVASGAEWADARREPRRDATGTARHAHDTRQPQTVGQVSFPNVPHGISAGRILTPNLSKAQAQLRLTHQLAM